MRRHSAQRSFDLLAIDINPRITFSVDSLGLLMAMPEYGPKIALLSMQIVYV